ncbi:MAG: hypothetical protein EAZ12_00490 [Sphingobacteriia bacterium]|nr:MAG: hypothetical protein EAZ12_00490 [Sphingobacteriia bacterium]
MLQKNPVEFKVNTPLRLGEILVNKNLILSIFCLAIFSIKSNKNIWEILEKNWPLLGKSPKQIGVVWVFRPFDITFGYISIYLNT